MRTESEHPHAAARQVLEALQNDLVSAGELLQIVANALPGTTVDNGFVADVVRQLLTEGVEIGETANIDGCHVKFLAWRGSVSDRCDRAIRQVESFSATDRAFAYWLCLRENVDEYETATPG